MTKLTVILILCVYLLAGVASVGSCEHDIQCFIQCSHISNTHCTNGKCDCGCGSSSDCHNHRYDTDCAEENRYCSNHDHKCHCRLETQSSNSHKCSRTDDCFSAFAHGHCIPRNVHCINGACQCQSIGPHVPGGTPSPTTRPHSVSQTKDCSSLSCLPGWRGRFQENECLCCYGLIMTLCVDPTTLGALNNSTYDCHNHQDCSKLKCHEGSRCYTGTSLSVIYKGVCYCDDICHSQSDCSHLRCDSHHYHACALTLNRCYCAKMSENHCLGGDVNHCHTQTCRHGTTAACHSGRCTCEPAVDSHTTPHVDHTTKQVTTHHRTTPTTKAATTPPTTKASTTPPAVKRRCHQCGDANNNYPCDLRTVYLGDVSDCPPGESYCMTDVVNDGLGSSEIFKRCVTKDVCKSEWVDQTSHNNRCVNYGNEQVNEHFVCHFCCEGDACNASVVPTNSTLYRPT